MPRHSILNVWYVFILLSCVILIATITVDGNTRSAQTSEAIKSLEATLEKKFDQLIAAVTFGQFGKRKCGFILFPFFLPC